MNHLDLDAAFADRLRYIHEAIELRDSDGKLLGVYTPSLTPEDQAAYEKARALFDREEIERRKAASSGRRRTTAEVLARLEELEKQPCDTP